MSEGTKWNNFLTLINHYKTDSDENNNYKYNYSQVFATNQSDDEIYPLTVAEIADAQRTDPKWKIFFKEDDPKGKIRSVIIDGTEVLVYDQSRLVIPQVLRTRAVQWYHHYLQHPDQTRRDTRCSDVLARHKSRRQTTCKVLQALPIRKTT